MPRSNAQKFKNFVSNILEPFALGLLALLFIIPTITVMNLSPITKKLKDLNVLGVNIQSAIAIDLVGGKHEVFTKENLTKSSENTYLYTSTLNKRGADNYSKPILLLQNNTETVQKLTFYGQTENSTQSNISIIVGDKSYKLQDTKAQTFPQEVSINPGEKITIFLSIENLSGVQFSEDFTMQIKVLETL